MLPRIPRFTPWCETRDRHGLIGFAWEDGLGVDLEMRAPGRDFDVDAGHDVAGRWRFHYPVPARARKTAGSQPSHATAEPWKDETS